MKANQWATLTLRLLGIYLLTIAIPLLVESFEPLFNAVRLGNIGAAIFAFLPTIGATLVIGALLIAFSVPLGAKLAPATTHHQDVTPVTFRQIETLAFAVAGLLIFAGALPQLFTSVFNLLFYLQSGNSRVYENGASYTRQATELAIGVSLKATIGLWLFFGTDGFANFFNSMRNLGTPTPPREQ